MSRTYKQRKYHAHKNNLRKEYMGIEKLWDCPICGLSCCGDKFGYRSTRGAKIKRRRYLRHCLKHNQDLYEELKEFYESDTKIRAIHMGSDSYRSVGQTLYGNFLPPLGLVIVGFVVMDDMEGGALLYNEETEEFFMGSDGDLTRAIGKIADPGKILGRK